MWRWSPWQLWSWLEQDSSGWSLAGDDSEVCLQQGLQFGEVVVPVVQCSHKLYVAFCH